MKRTLLQALRVALTRPSTKQSFIKDLTLGNVEATALALHRMPYLAQISGVYFYAIQNNGNHGNGPELISRLAFKNADTSFLLPKQGEMPCAMNLLAYALWKGQSDCIMPLIRAGAEVFHPSVIEVIELSKDKIAEALSGENERAAVIIDGICLADAINQVLKAQHVLDEIFGRSPKLIPLPMSEKEASEIWSSNIASVGAAGVAEILNAKIKEASSRAPEKPQCNEQEVKQNPALWAERTSKAPPEPNTSKAMVQ